MTLLFSMVRGSSDSRSAPLKSRSLAPQCHCYCTLKCNDGSSSYAEISALYTSHPSLQWSKFLSYKESHRKKNATLGREWPVPHLQGYRGTRAVSKHSVWRLAGQKLFCTPPCVCSGLATEIRTPCCKSESNSRIQSLQTWWTLPGLPGTSAERERWTVPALQHPGWVWDLFHTTPSCTGTKITSRNITKEKQSKRKNNKTNYKQKTKPKQPCIWLQHTIWIWPCF